MTPIPPRDDHICLERLIQFTYSKTRKCGIVETDDDWGFTVPYCQSWRQLTGFQWRNSQQSLFPSAVCGRERETYFTPVKRVSFMLHSFCVHTVGQACRISKAQKGHFTRLNSSEEPEHKNCFQNTAPSSESNPYFNPTS